MKVIIFASCNDYRYEDNVWVPLGYGVFGCAMEILLSLNMVISFEMLDNLGLTSQISLCPLLLLLFNPTGKLRRIKWQKVQNLLDFLPNTGKVLLIPRILIHIGYGYGVCGYVHESWSIERTKVWLKLNPVDQLVSFLITRLIY